MNTIPAVSVLLPVYNGERYLEDAMRSVLSQSMADLELIVIDDGSVDGTREVISRFDDARIRVISKASNEGVVAALNDGLNAARGAFVARMDADDWSHPDRLATQVGYLKRRPEVDLVGCYFAYLDPTLSRVLSVPDLPTSRESIRWRLLFESCIPGASVVARRRFYSRGGGYDPAFPVAEDHELWLRNRRVAVMENVPRVLYLVRTHPASLCQTASMEQAILSVKARTRAVSEDLDGWASTTAVRILGNPVESSRRPIEDVIEAFGVLGGLLLHHMSDSLDDSDRTFILQDAAATAFKVLRAFGRSRAVLMRSMVPYSRLLLVGALYRIMDKAFNRRRVRSMKWNDAQDTLRIFGMVPPDRADEDLGGRRTHSLLQSRFEK